MRRFNHIYSKLRIHTNNSKLLISIKLSA
ncbi:hypothetical protein LMANV2_80044 [Leptospira interrogans serovar Manilae]|uniref:Uncharacterized protein n=1 Tax=Leptospira interrogans serovar Manilae TaxID=214675 RepID=A0AAQ1P2J7_LEPIR|nr:hypothetical protein LMANV2_80044 [Leptospira interrogans serovar Manilae]